MQIYLIRHGSTTGNLEHRYVGTTDEGLTPEAVDQLKVDRGRYPVPERVYVSPLKRCQETAALLFPEADQIVLSDLRECDFGAFEYKNYEELQENADYQAWIDSGGTLAFPGGESREEFCARCCRAFETGCQDAAAAKVSSAAFVVHGGTIMAVLDRYSRPHRDYFDWQVKNARGFSCQMEKDLMLTNMEALPARTERIGIEDQFVMKKNKKLRCGYTTGSCATAAAKAAAEMLLSGRIVEYADFMTPKGVALHVPILDQKMESDRVSCAVRKYGGDDPDATDGILICATVEKAERTGEEQIIIDGGIGVGRVTKPGLEQPVGAAAINRVPREMIRRETESICELYEYSGCLKVTVWVPQGEETARKTFNPHIGIIGGISILGTKGIVVPMSEEALIASIRVEMKQKVISGEQYLLITPGNYGADFIRKKERSEVLDAEHSMKCSNYVGETLDIAEELGVKGILFVAHIGKFIKVSGGVMNTHSAHADCRAELMAAQAMRAGAHAETVKALLNTNTTEEALGIIKAQGILSETIQETLSRIRFHLQKRCRGTFETEVILFSNQYGYLGETEGADVMMGKIIEQQKKKTGGWTQ